MVKENKYIKTYHNFNVEPILINGYSIRVRQSIRLKKRYYHLIDKKTFSTRFKNQIQNQKNYHTHSYYRKGDKIFYCTTCNNLKCCNTCPDCNSKIYSHRDDFDSDSELKIDSSDDEDVIKNNVISHSQNEIIDSNSYIANILNIFF